jgi:hypothetical protein
MRGTHHLESKHTFRITTSGAEVFPRIETLDSGEATIILGPSGPGKTIRTSGPTPEPAGGGVTFLFHNLIQLRYVELVSATGRALNIVKMRNSNHAKNLYQFEIGEQGPEIGDQREGVTGALGWSALRAANAIR